MDLYDRKMYLRRKLRESTYPRRAAAKFDEANDHNPLILQDCPECRGSGKRDICTELPNGGRTWELGACSACGGTGITGEVEHYFLKNAPEVTALPDAKGWLRCPACRIVFTTHDRYRWTGYRHLSCGQRIRLLEAESAASDKP